MLAAANTEVGVESLERGVDADVFQAVDGEIDGLRVQAHAIDAGELRGLAVVSELTVASGGDSVEDKPRAVARLLNHQFSGVAGAVDAAINRKLVAAARNQ